MSRRAGGTAAVRHGRHDPGQQHQLGPAHRRRHLQQPRPGPDHWGAADQPFPNLLDPDYRTAARDVDMNGPARRWRLRRAGLRRRPRTSPGRSSSIRPPRTISNLIVDSRPPTRPRWRRRSTWRASRATRRPIAICGHRGRGRDLSRLGQRDRRGSRRPRSLQVASRRKASRWPAIEPGHAERLARRGPVGVRSTRGSRCSASSSTTASTSSPRGRAAPSSSRCSPTTRSTSRAATTNFMVLTRATVDGQGQAHEPHHALRRPEPDLHLASLAPGLPARVRDDGRRAGRHRHAARRRRTADCPPGPRSRRRPRTCSASSSTDVHVGNLPLLATDPYGNFIPGPGGFPQVVMYNDPNNPAAGTHLESGTPGAPLNLANDIAGWPRPGHGAGLRSTSQCAPATPSSTTSPTPPSRCGLGRRRHRDRPEQRRTARRPPAPTTTSCSTRTSSPATAAATRTSA